ncbi:MAG: dienelactone hydrolase, partial [Calditrichaeota bacterium]
MSARTENLSIELDSRNKVELIVQGIEGDRPILVLAHGAGNDMRHPFFEQIAGGLLDAGIGVVRFNFPYRTAGRKIPDREPVLRKAWVEVVHLVQRRYAPDSLFIGGKSMGGRIAALVAPELAGLRGLVFLGYPLHPPGKPDQLRDA